MSREKRPIIQVLQIELNFALTHLNIGQRTASVTSSRKVTLMEISELQTASLET